MAISVGPTGSITTAWTGRYRRDPAFTCCEGSASYGPGDDSRLSISQLCMATDVDCDCLRGYDHAPIVALRQERSSQSREPERR